MGIPGDDEATEEKPDLVVVDRLQPCSSDDMDVGDASGELTIAAFSANDGDDNEVGDTGG